MKIFSFAVFLLGIGLLGWFQSTWWTNFWGKMINLKDLFSDLLYLSYYERKSSLRKRIKIWYWYVLIVMTMVWTEINATTSIFFPKQEKKENTSKAMNFKTRGEMTNWRQTVTLQSSRCYHAGSNFVSMSNQKCKMVRIHLSHWFGEQFSWILWLWHRIRAFFNLTRW